ncbi:AT hook domain-containing protein [Phlyctema vagabunda]|uniref:AT hook domain-containing protein n=1 Tax=Phlyctema vagabunda TaxID=108571 RepID=A0ABR4P5U4_9HELO
MDQARQDRLQQRLRGAQRREIKDVDFGLFLPPPSLAPPPTPFKAPEVEQPSQAQPVTQSQPEVTPQPTRRSPRRSPSQARISRNPSFGSTSAFDANTSAKRRKLEVDDAARTSSSRSSRSAQPPRADIYDIPQDPVEPDVSRQSIPPTQRAESAILEQGPTIIESGTDTTDNNVVMQEGSSRELPLRLQVQSESEEVPDIIRDGSIDAEEVESVVRVTRNKRKRSVESPAESSQEQPRRQSARISDASISSEDQAQPLSQKPRRQSGRVSDVSIDPEPLTQPLSQKPRRRSGRVIEISSSLEVQAQPLSQQPRRRSARVSDIVSTGELSVEQSPEESRRRSPRVNDDPSTVETPAEPSSEQSQRRSTRISDATIVAEPVSPAAPEPEPQTQPRGKKRGRKPKLHSAASPIITLQFAKEVPEAEVPEGIEESEEAEEIEDVEAATLLKKNRNSRRISGGVPEPGSQEEISSPRLLTHKKPRGKNRPVASPQQQRQPKTKASKTRRPETQKRQRLGSPIPVIVHRLTERPQYSDSESDAEILNAEIPFAHRKGVNPIDVLSQFCDEVITSALETLESGIEKAEEAATKREYKTKWRAVEEFGREVQNRLIEHTINLDNNFALTRRLREEKRNKLALRGEILQIRSEREKVALKMDDIRSRHEKESLEFEKRNTLNTSMHDIELALERGKSSLPSAPAAKQKPKDAETEVELAGIEVLMKRIAGEVSSTSAEGGILAKIRAFNAFLERAAVALEA